MKTRIKIRSGPALSMLGLALLLVASSGAQEPNPNPEQPNPDAQQPNPDARAARLSFVQGEVQLTQGGQLLADPAVVNTPLFKGADIKTKDDGTAEIQFDDGTVVRVSPNSSVKIALLKQQNGMGNGEVDLESGLAYFEMPGDTSTNRMVARFGDSTVTTSGFTVLRIGNDTPPGELAVFNGNAHLVRVSALSLDLHGGESVALNENDPNQYNLAETIEPNSWDAWNADRDQELSSEQAAKTAASGSQPNSSNPAWGDLDANGQWYNVPDQGYVWSPYEAASGDWDPYGCGSWVWNPQFGYSWVSCESWGYLPYTCGYWNFYDGFGWGWTPGMGYPWWTTGGWTGNVGRRPARWEPPHRPHGGPVHPPVRHGGLYQPNPVIAVNRIPKAPVANPVHVVGRPVTIAGSTVEPMRPLSPRPVYNHTTAPNVGRTFQGTGNPGYVVSPRPGNPGYGYSGRSGYSTPTNPGRPGTWSAPAPGGTYRAPAPAPGGVYRAPVAPAPRSYSGGGSYANHTYSGGGSRPSSGGGGHVSAGGGGHPSGGGGGGGHVSAGGSGGSHASGGGHH
jgi:hypothetical protein